MHIAEDKKNALTPSMIWITELVLTKHMTFSSACFKVNVR